MCVPSVGLFMLPEDYVALLGIWMFAVLCAVLLAVVVLLGLRYVTEREEGLTRAVVAEDYFVWKGSLATGAAVFVLSIVAGVRLGFTLSDLLLPTISAEMLVFAVFVLVGYGLQRSVKLFEAVENSGQLWLAVPYKNVDMVSVYCYIEPIMLIQFYHQHTRKF
jgi:hypothetical protein